MNKAQLIEALENYPDDAEIIVRTLEADEVCLTVTLTSIEPHRSGAVVLVGDLDDVIQEGEASHAN